MPIRNNELDSGSVMLKTTQNYKIGLYALPNHNLANLVWKYTMHQSLIKRIEIDKLFGKLSHSIPKQGAISSAAILYGDNGVGKSSILNIVFHLLSPADDRGHRTALSQIPFKKVEVELHNGIVISAEREVDVKSKALTFIIRNKKKIVAEWFFTGEKPNYGKFDDSFTSMYFLNDLIKNQPSKADESAVSKLILKQLSNKKLAHQGKDPFLSGLKHYTPRIFYLNADRKLDGDTVVEALDAAEMRHHIRDLRNISDFLRFSRSVSLTQALENAARWVQIRAVSGTNRGSENAHSAYEAILNQLTTFQSHVESRDSHQAFEMLGKQIEQIENDTKNYSKYELAAELKMDKFKLAINNHRPDESFFAARIIKPYIDGLKNKSDAIRPIYEVIDNFVSLINEFLIDKTIMYTLSQGFHIVDSEGSALDPAQLSSGEQQLILIFSHVLAARDSQSVFIIDEPEISLNIKWQRRIVNALLSVASDSDIQFIFASHSLELISQHARSVVEIGRR